jgi:hypothetical protein
MEPPVADERLSNRNLNWKPRCVCNFYLGYVGEFLEQFLCCFYDNLWIIYG